MDDQLSALERQMEEDLRTLLPSLQPRSRDELMFRAGSLAARRHVANWRAASGVMAVALVGLLVISPPIRSSRRDTVQSSPVAAMSVAVNTPRTDGPEVLLQTMSPLSYRSLRTAVLEGAPAAISSPAPRFPSRDDAPAQNPANYRALLKTM